MFKDEGPIGAMNVMQRYIALNVANFPADTQEEFLKVNAERSPADALIKGMEYLNTALVNGVELPNRDEALNALGVVALQVANANLWSKGDRAFAIMAWANGELNGASGGGELPAPVEPDEAYGFAEPEASPEAPPPSPEPTPAPAPEPTPLPAPEPEPG